VCYEVFAGFSEHATPKPAALYQKDNLTADYFTAE
jgi:hypothetical protein